MNIGFYGNSTASWSGHSDSFIDIIQQRFGATVVNIGTPQGSEERILYSLKKTKAIDIAVIFHGGPGFYFIPKCNRDLRISTIPENKVKYLWNENNSDLMSPQAFEEKYFDPNSGIKKIFGTIDNFVNCMTYYREYLWDPDAEKYRYEAFLMAVDDYCLKKVKLTIHVMRPKFKVSWFDFKSGIESIEIANFVESFKKILNTTGTTEKILPNGLTVAGNLFVADELTKLIKQHYQGVA
jgi:hypothetical protein